MAEDSNDRTPVSKSTRRYEKPRPDFPLSIHQGTGYWCKKVKGHVYYFGRVEDDPKGVAAEEEWLRLKDDPDALAGGEPRDPEEELTVNDLVNHFLSHKEALRDNGELSPRTYNEYHSVCEIVIRNFGKKRTVLGITPDDFRKLRLELAKCADGRSPAKRKQKTGKRGAVSLRNIMQRTRSLFKFGFDDGLISKPIRFGKAFTKPKADAVRREREAHRNEHGDRMFEANEIRLMLNYLDGREVTLKRVDENGAKPTVLRGKAKPILKAMLLLAANAGFGQTDVANLPIRVINFETGWLDFARVKTAVPRLIPLWPETVDAVKQAIKLRPKAKDPADEGLLFLTRRGQRWVTLNDDGSPKDAIGQEFNKLLVTLALKRSRVGFYAFRHGFETIAGETADQVAVDRIMGHVPQGMSAAYRERIGNDRLNRVVNHVHDWLFAASTNDGGSSDESEADNATIPMDQPSDDADHQAQQSEAVLRLFVG